MAMGDIPQIHDSRHTHSIYALGDVGSTWGNVINTGTAATSIGNIAQQSGRILGNILPDSAASTHDFVKQWKEEEHSVRAVQKIHNTQGEAKVKRRLVQVFIADPDEHVPLEDSILYSGDQKLTDSTDQELFFEIDIKSILEIHNKKRVKFVNKKVKERTEYLEPVKIRELKMVVVSIAEF